jgi:hypothetical protein
MRMLMDEVHDYLRRRNRCLIASADVQAA